MSRKILFMMIPALALAAAGASASQIRGDYIESRSADVYTGQCFANGEVNLVGNQALVAWKIRSGNWEGVALDGLIVAGAVRANATLGDPYANPIRRGRCSSWTSAPRRVSGGRSSLSPGRWGASS